MLDGVKGRNFRQFIAYIGHGQNVARVTGIREGVVFVPFHYGYWDEPEGSEPNGRARAANELTITRWDPVSKQPVFKVAAVRVEKVAAREQHAEVAS